MTGQSPLAALRDPTPWAGALTVGVGVGTRLALAAATTASVVLGASALPAAVERDVSVSGKRGGIDGRVEGSWSAEELAAGEHRNSETGPVTEDTGFGATSGGFGGDGGGGDGGA